MKKGTYIRLEKIDVHPEARLPSPEMKDYRLGELNFYKSLPIGYTLEGILLQDIVLGNHLKLERFIRNGIPIKGLTITSPILLIKKDILLTENSVYRVTVLEEPELQWADGDEPEFDQEP
jgi:hypothetical protein